MQRDPHARRDLPRGVDVHATVDEDLRGLLDEPVPGEVLPAVEAERVDALEEQLVRAGTFEGPRDVGLRALMHASARVERRVVRGTQHRRQVVEVTLEHGPHEVRLGREVEVDGGGRDADGAGHRAQGGRRNSTRTCEQRRRGVDELAAEQVSLAARVGSTPVPRHGAPPRAGGLASVTRSVYTCSS